MISIDRVAAFKFIPLTHVVNTTKTNGYPQLVIEARAIAIFNEETGQWEETFTDENGAEHPWSSLDMQTTMYLVLCNAEKPMRNHEQVMQAFGWDGQSLGGLNDMDLTKTPFLGQVRENVYNGVTTLRVEWIDNADADPTRTIKALSPEDLRSLDAKFGGILPGKVAPPAKPPATAPVVPPPAKPATPAPVDPTPAPTAEPAPATAAPSADDTSSSDTPPIAPPTPPAPKAAAKPKAKAKGKGKKADKPFGVEGMTKDESWQKVVELQKEGTTDEHRSNAFIEAVAIVVGDPSIEDLSDRFHSIDEDSITAVQWRDVAAKTLDILPDSHKF